MRVYELTGLYNTVYGVEGWEAGKKLRDSLVQRNLVNHTFVAGWWAADGGVGCSRERPSSVFLHRHLTSKKHKALLRAVPAHMDSKFGGL